MPQVCLGLGEYFRDVYDHLVRLNQSIDSLRDMVTTAISVNLSLITLARTRSPSGSPPTPRWSRCRP